MVKAVYAIDDFPQDGLLWRIEWIGGVGHNMSVPSDPLIDVCLAQLPAGETNPRIVLPGKNFRVAATDFSVNLTVEAMCSHHSGIFAIRK
jgi:hypothetical protein